MKNNLYLLYSSIFVMLMIIASCASEHNTLYHIPNTNITIINKTIDSHIISIEIPHNAQFKPYFTSTIDAIIEKFTQRLQHITIQKLLLYMNVEQYTDNNITHSFIWLTHIKNPENITAHTATKLNVNHSITITNTQDAYISVDTLFDNDVITAISNYSIQQLATLYDKRYHDTLFIGLAANKINFQSFALIPKQLLIVIPAGQAVPYNYGPQRIFIPLSWLGYPTIY